MAGKKREMIAEKMTDEMNGAPDMQPAPEKQPAPEMQAAPIEGNKKPAIVNCLENRTVIVRSLVLPSNIYKDPDHIMRGGHASFEATYVTPVLSSGNYVNVLTNNEKACLEQVLGRDLGIYAKDNNIWDEIKVTLKKGDNKFDMSNPMDYIKVKILQANKNAIAPSLNALNDRPKATYRFVIIEESQVRTNKMRKFDAKQRANRLIGKYEDDRQTLITLLELLSGRPVSSRTETDDILLSLDDYITADPVLFVKFAEDPLLKAKTLLRRCVDARIVSRRNGMYFKADDNMPLCDDGQEATLSVAAAFISDPRRAELKYSLEKKLNIQ